MASFDQATDDVAFDALAAAGDPTRAFLRARWFTGAERHVLRDANGEAVAALGVVERRKGPFALREVGGCYWPFRGVPLASGLSADDLAEALTRSDLGSIWRLGPVDGDDPQTRLLAAAAVGAGWMALTRPLGTLFELDLAALTGDGEWPSAKTQRKNRWRKRRLEEDGGPLRTEYFTGADWTVTQRDAMAAIEAASWLGKLPGGGDTKFRDPALRAYWESLTTDPILAEMLFGSLLWIGDIPAAFTFGVQVGSTRYYIANNYDERFNQFGPGRVLLYDDFARAAAAGVAKVSWGLGDAGYKSEMGAKPGPQLVDFLFVRGRILPHLLRRIWERPA